MSGGYEFRTAYVTPVESFCRQSMSASLSHSNEPILTTDGNSRSEKVKPKGQDTMLEPEE